MDKDFLHRVWGLQEPKVGYLFCLATKKKNSEQWEDHFFQWPLKDKKLSQFERDYPKEKYNVYFCPTPFNNPQRKKSFVIGSKLLWADLDNVAPKSLELTPQIAWKSSNKRFASLWVLDIFYDAQTIEQRNKALSYTIGADKGGWDLTQVLRLPGTLNHKYSPSERVRVLWDKEGYTKLKKFPKHIFKEVDLKQYKLRESTKRLLNSKSATEGKRSEVIWKLNNDMAEQGIDAEGRFNLLRSSLWNKFAGRGDEEVQLMREVEKVPTIAKKEKKEDDSIVVCMSDVQAENVEYLWEPYIALGKLTLLEGDPGLGKSWFTLALAAHVSSNKKLPREKNGFSGKVLLLSVEDGLADTIRPRLDALHANVKNIYAYNKRVYLDEDGVEEIEDQIKKYNPKLVIVDPLMAFVGGQVDTNKANEVTEICARLAQLAERHHIAIIAIRHHNKASGVKAIHRGQGSIAFTGTTRSIMMIGQHPEDELKRCIVHVKNNIGMKGETIEYSLDKDRNDIFRFEGFSYLTEEDVLDVKRSNDNAKLKDAAAKLISDTLTQGKYIEQELMFRNAEAAGIDKTLLKRVAEKLEVKKIKIRGKIRWTF